MAASSLVKVVLRLKHWADAIIAEENKLYKNFIKQGYGLTQNSAQ